MPLTPGKSRTAISRNIDELTHSQTKAGKARNARPHAHAQNVAIAMHEAFDKKPKSKKRR